MWYWIILSLIPLTGVVYGLIEGIREQKHKKDDTEKKSHHGLWVAIITLGILSAWNNKKKNK